jgi:gliding motility-associated-like protein
VQFTDLSSPGVGNTNVAWLWDFGNGTQSTQQNPLVTYTTGGNFTITLKVTNDKGCVKVISRPNYIQVPNGVVAKFTHTQSVVCHPPSNISFTNLSTGPGSLNYSWNFGDGNNSNLPNPVHAYATGGTFTITLTTTSSAGCTDTETHSVTILNNVAAMTFPDSACVNTAVSFMNTSVPASDSSYWDFGDGSNSTVVNPVKTYTTVGNYTVKLLATFPTCHDSVFKTIRILARPVANFTAPDTTRCQPPLTVNFQDLTPGAVSWKWDFGDGGNSTLQNPTHTYTSYGIFSVRLIVTNGSGCTDTLIKPMVKIKRATISIPAFPAAGCVPFTINPVPNIVAFDTVLTYLWNFGDGFTSTLQNPVHTYPTQGTYNVTLTITTSGGCADTLIVPGAVHAGTHTTPNFTASPLTVCAFQPVNFTDLTPPPVNQWLWYFGDGNTSTLQNPNHIYEDTGRFTVTLVAFNNGCPDSIKFFNYVHVLPPIAKFSALGDCSNRLLFNFTDLSIGALTWFWDFGDGATSNAQNPNHTYATLGVYTVKLTVTNGTCSHFVTQLVNAINENPDFNADQTVACRVSYIRFHAQNVTTSNIQNYHWDFGNLDTTTITGVDIGSTYANTGAYTVTLITTDVNGCKDTITKPNYIRINGPVVDFSATNVSGCKGLTTTFNDLSTTDGIHPITNWRFDFGDGVVQNFSSPPFTHVYATAGVFGVKLIATDASGCKDSLIKSNLITTTDPKAGFVSFDTLSCPNAVVQFYNTSNSPGFISDWYFGDGGTSTLKDAFYRYAASGDYTVKLVITDAAGCKDSLIRNLYVHIQNPAASFTVNDSATSCTPFEVNFTNTSQYYISNSWDFGNGGTSTLTNPTVYYTVPGTYIAWLYVVSPGYCVDSVKKTITIFDTAGARINYTPLGGCKPLQISLNAISSGNTGTFIWDYGDGVVDSTLVPNVTHIYDVFGDYIPKVILKDPAGCLIPIAGIDTVKIKGAEAKFGFDNRFFCDSGFVNFIDSTTFNDPITQYQWNFGDGATSNLQNPVHQYINPGFYTVDLTIQTLSGCKDSLRLLDTIKIVQSPLVDIAGDTSVCVNDPMLLNGMFMRPDTSIVKWSWTFPNGNTATGQNPSQQVYTTPGNYVVTTVATNSSGCKDTTTTGIIIYPLPTATVPGTMTMQAGFPITIPATYAPNVVSYLWAPSSTLSCSTCPQPVASPKLNTNYSVIFTDSNGCKNSALTRIVVICKNANVFVPNTFTPNGDGTNDAFYPRGRGINRVKLLRIFDRWGEVVFEAKDFPINDPNFGWNGNYKGNKPQPGVYIYQVEFYCDNGDLIHFEGNVALIL